MPDRDVAMTAGGVAHWGQQLPIGGNVRAVGYSADLMTRLSTGTETRYLRTVFIGMDKVRPDESGEWGDDSGGFGHFQMEDVHSGDTVSGRIDWRVDDRQDYGTFHFTEGTGLWKGVQGAMPDVRLDWCTRDNDGDLASGHPITLLAFVEGRGQLSFPD